MSDAAVLGTGGATRARRRLERLPRWIRVLTGGALLWGLAVAVLFATDDLYVAAAVVLGTFVVPLALYVRFADGEQLPGVGRELMLRLFACGGLLGFLAAAFIERPLLSQPELLFAGWVGVIEEATKLAVLAFMTRAIVDKGWRSGFVLGGLVGLGFSAFESAGYALASVVDSGSGRAVVETVLTRAATVPLTHGLWTAIAGAALFAASRDGRFRLAPLVLAALAGVAAAHAGWDMAPRIASDMESRLAGASSAHAARIGDNLVDDAGLALVSLPTLYVAYRLRRRKGASTDRPASSGSGPAGASGRHSRRAQLLPATSCRKCRVNST